MEHKGQFQKDIEVQQIKKRLDGQLFLKVM